MRAFRSLSVLMVIFVVACESPPGFDEEGAGPAGVPTRPSDGTSRSAAGSSGRGQVRVSTVESRPSGQAGNNTSGTEPSSMLPTPPPPVPPPSIVGGGGIPTGDAAAQGPENTAGQPVELTTNPQTEQPIAECPVLADPTTSAPCPEVPQAIESTETVF
jgi:hypothetical protein